MLAPSSSQFDPKPTWAPPQLLHLIREERRAWTLAKAVPSS